MPDFPVFRLLVTSSRLLPRQEIIPIPVTTTRLINLSLPAPGTGAGVALYKCDGKAFHQYTVYDLGSGLDANATLTFAVTSGFRFLFAVCDRLFCIQYSLNFGFSQSNFGFVLDQTRCFQRNAPQRAGAEFVQQHLRH